MSDRILSLLGQLYAPQDAAAAYAALQERMAKTPKQLSRRTVLYDERDVLLITYGDSLQDRETRPLQTLHAFAAARLRELFSGIHILPFYPYSSDDGFAVIDFYQVNPSLGTWEDIAALGEHFDLMFDAVFNHMSAKSQWFQQFLADAPEYQGLFRTELPETDLSMVVRPRVSPLLTPFTKADGSTVYVWTTFSADQVDFDAATPATLLRLLDVLLFYVEKGASFIRLDAIAFFWKTVGTNCLHLPQTHAVIQLMRAVLDEVAPHVVLITETNVPHLENISYWGDGYHEAQLVYNFTLPPLLFYSMVIGSTRKLRDWVNTLKTPSERTTFFNFTASHDGIGVRGIEGILTHEERQVLLEETERKGGRVSYRRQSDGSQVPYELNITYVDAVTRPEDTLDQQAAAFLVSQGIMLALAGVPAVYIHSLLGSRNDYVGMTQTGHNRTINRAKLDVNALEAALQDENTLRQKIFVGYARLLKVRRSLAAFHPNALQQAVDAGNDAVLVLVRGEGRERVQAVFNLTPRSQTLSMPLHGRDALTGNCFHGEKLLTPYQMLWLVQDKH